MPDQGHQLSRSVFSDMVADLARGHEELQGAAGKGCPSSPRFVPGHQSRSHVSFKLVNEP